MTSALSFNFFSVIFIVVLNIGRPSRKKTSMEFLLYVDKSFDMMRRNKIEIKLKLIVCSNL